MNIEQPIAFSTFDPLYRYLLKGNKKQNQPRTRREKALVRLKHLPGRHNQQSHGRRGGSGGGGVGSASTSEAVAKFNDWNDREIARIEQTMERVKNWLINPSPTSFTGSEIDSLQKMYEDMYGQNDSAQRLIISNAQRFGLSVEDTARLIRNRNIVKGINNGSFAVDDVSIGRALLSDHYNEQRIRISRMSKDEQQQLLVEIDAKQSRTPWDYDRAAALTIYADPEVRWDAIRFMKKNENGASRMRIIAGKNVGDERMDVRSPMETMQFYSLDYRLYNSLDKAGLANVPYSQIFGSGNAVFDDFMQSFSYTHTSQSTDNVLGAQIQYAVSQVGLNANAPRPPSFFPRGVNTPQTNPELKRLLDMQYEATQQRYAGSQPPRLYRGTNDDFALGIPMSPWSDVQLVAMGFAKMHPRGKQIVNSARVSSQYIFMDNSDPNWNTIFPGENEYLVLETAYVNSSKKKITPGGFTINLTGQQYPEIQSVEWTEKAMNAELPEPQSYLEQNYDIFYNYRKKSQTRREKAIARLKADFEARGNTPGRKWDESQVSRDEAGRFAKEGGRARRAVALTRQFLLEQGGPKPKKKPAKVERNRAAERQAAGEAGMAELGYEAGDFKIIDSQEPQNIEDSRIRQLVDAGLMEEVNGKAYPTTLGRRIAKAVGSGNIGAAREALDRAEAKRQAAEEKRRATKEVGWTPPAGVRAAARRGLELRSEFGRGGTAVGIARARDLANGKSIPLTTIRRMTSFFARHAVDKRPGWSDASNPSNGYIAHLLWGGDAGRSWANGIAKRNED